ncbi:MAG: hypothetical protein HY782_14110 [Chloroflexi bacterium]|nr:hypothetical protein [Chloroflexota bacterium]
MPTQIRILRHLRANHRSPEEHGQAVVIVALSIIGLLAMAGLVFDGGNAYVQRRRMQNAADGASLAGTNILAVVTNSSAVTECAIRVAVERYAKSNGVPGPNPDPSCNSLNSNIKAYFVNSSGTQVGVEIGLNSGVPSGARGVRVVPQTTFSTFFLGILNQTLGAANAQAAAIYGAVKSPSALGPIAVQCDKPSLDQCFTFGQTYDIFDGLGPGNKGWLGFNGVNNAPNIEKELDPNYPDPPLDHYVDPDPANPPAPYTHYEPPCSEVAVGCWVQGEPGGKNSNGIRNNLNLYWVNQERVFPIYDVQQGSGSHNDYHIVGFAVFIIRSYDLPHGRITGEFVRAVTSGEICLSGCMDTGLRTTVLTQ